MKISAIKDLNKIANWMASHLPHSLIFTTYTN